MKSHGAEVLIVAVCAALVMPMPSTATHPPKVQIPNRTLEDFRAMLGAHGETPYVFTTIDAPGASDTEAFGINNSGLITGFYVIGGLGHGFWWRNGTLHTVQHSTDPNEDTLLGHANDLDLVAGNYGSQSSQHAAIYSILANKWITLPDIAGKPINVGNGINLWGSVVGAASTGSLIDASNSVGWIWDGKAYSFFTAPGAAQFGTEPVGINALGLVSGYFQDAGGSFHGFLKAGSKFKNVDVPDATDTFALGINSFADQAGYYFGQDGNAHGFVLWAGVFTTVDVPGSSNTLVTDINDGGDLTGLSFDAKGTHGFIAHRH